MKVDIVKNKTIEIVIAYVESESKNGMFYKVTYDGEWNCTCPAGIHRGECKHILAVREEVNE
jgi:uncharacterized Zn finger protein